MDEFSLNITLKKSGPPGTEGGSDRPPMARLLRLLKSGPDSPLLAPRGLCLTGNTLLVSDTGQNRVCIWKNVAEAGPDSAPDLVLGQTETHHTGRNGGKEVSASSLQYPSGIWSDGQRLIVADAWNHRVLIWHQMPEVQGQAADVVLGQPDFEHNQPNVSGIGADPSDTSLNWPYGVHSDGERLWIADTGNRRILFFDHIPTQNYAPATQVAGKSSFFERDYSPADAVWPYSIKIGPQGEMAVADTQYFRVLIWKQWQQAFSQPADVIIGQADFDSSGANQYGLYPQPHTLNWCYDTCFYEKGLFVADTGNSRVLWFEQLPAVSNAPATDLIGKRNFFTGSENIDTVSGTEGTLYWPFSLSIAGKLMAVADTGNHRIALYELP
ncbi:MAG: hypothetical protein EAZ89_19205 [Bacteroidetes bacterium]|nr:MAG: hypothetical protein EAZ89_19205 [Bacteroidota bacterium]